MSIVTTPAAAPPGSGRAALGAGWPLVVLLCGLPLWWLLGLFSFMPLLMSLPMAWQLARMPSVHLPRGFGWWLLFLVWVLLGAGVLWAQAPGTVAGGGFGRVLVFGYRFWWYAACTIVLLWVANIPRQVLSDRRVHRAVGSVFALTALGGLVGVLRPELELRSLFELLLPGPLRGNEFISSMVHLEVADLQTVLDRPEPRPKAPFPFTNSWGSGLSLSLVFFIAALRGTTRRTRIAAGVLMVVALVPVLYSLNRGLWASLAAGAVAVVAVLLLRGRPSVTAATAGGLAVLVVVGMLSPLGGLVGERMANQHSNERRGQLLESTVVSVSTGSPVIGFGSTRDVQGSFASIAGAATPDCPACGVPPLGTQGQLWLILFSQGWLGLAFFLVFVVLALSRCWRCRTPNQMVCAFVLGFFLLQLPVYDSLGLSLYLVMIAIGLMAREDRLDGSRSQPLDAHRRTAAHLAGRVRGSLPTLVLLVVTGGALGYVVAAASPPVYERTVSIELAPAPVALERAVAQIEELDPAAVRVRDLTLDTESALLRSAPALAAASEASGTPAADLDAAIEIGAVPNTRVLTVTVRAGSPDQTLLDSESVARAYLDVRTDWLAHRRTTMRTAVEKEIDELVTSGVSGKQSRDYLTTVLARLTSTDDSPGTIVSASPVRPAPARHPEAVTSGIGLGLLAGCALLTRTTRRTP